MSNTGEADRSVRIVGANAQADESVFVVNNMVVAGSPSPGDVPVVQADGSLAWGAGGGGGGGAGSPVVRKFPFAFNTPGLLTGHAVYTPTIGDILLDAWIEIDTAWDGITPLGDIGSFVANNVGWFSDTNQSVEMTRIDSNLWWGDGSLLSGNFPSSIPINDLSLRINLAGGGSTPGSAAMKRLLPAKFLTADPIKVCVSQDGINTGADPGSTQGSAVLYLVTCTPA